MHHNKHCGIAWVYESWMRKRLRMYGWKEQPQNKLATIGTRDEDAGKSGRLRVHRPGLGTTDRHKRDGPGILAEPRRDSGVGSQCKHEAAHRVYLRFEPLEVTLSVDG